MNVKVTNLEKKYGKKTVFDNLNMKFDIGICGLLGPNGAGKSTLMKILTTNISDYVGKVLFNDIDIRQLGKEYRKVVGYMPQKQSLYEDFSLEQYLYYIGRLKGIDKRKINKEIDLIIKNINLDNVANKKINTYSGGMKQRAMFAQAILGNPQVLILDEPSAGLDPEERVNIRNLIAKNSKSRITIISTHIVSDIEYIADYILIMKLGKIIKTGTPLELKSSIKEHVGILYISEKELDKFKTEYTTRIISQNNEIVKINIIGDNLPNNCKKADMDDINLEDVYIYYMKKNVYPI